MATGQLYDSIGHGYANARQADPRIHAQLLDALGSAETVVNVGAGTGNYEPTDRRVVAVEPNAVMAAQRSSNVPLVRAFAEHLPFSHDSFDASLAMFTIHHWHDREAGLSELSRVSARQVALMYDSALTRRFWLADYFPALGQEPDVANPSAMWASEHVDVIEERPMMVPSDCTDGFAGCYWNRPDRYLDDDVQAGMSVLAKLSPQARAEGSARLADALESGEWDDRHGHLRDLEEFDIGYRIVICGS